MKTAVIITAAGRGTRMGGDLPKQWRLLAGKPVLEHTVNAFAGFHIVLVLHPDEFMRAANWDVELVAGGLDRAASVRAGLESLAGRGFDQVLIHDGARPLVDRDVIDGVLIASRLASAINIKLPLGQMCKELGSSLCDPSALAGICNSL